MIVFPTGAWAEGASFDQLLSTHDLWTFTQDNFQAANRELPFRWTSTARESARAARPGMTLFGLPLVEVIARFDGGRISGITANIYARGDAGNLPKEKYDALIRASADAISKATGVKAIERGKDPASAVNADGLVWRTVTGLYTLEYSFTREMRTRGIPFRAEFVRLSVVPPPQGAGSLLTAAPGPTPRFNPAAHIQRDAATGDVFIKDVPMIDQGAKGYCVVASAERVLRYYGVAVDANELAQIANSNATGGTSYPAMISALRKIAGRSKVRVQEIQRIEARDFLALIKEYNRVARETGAAEVSVSGQVIDMAAIYGAMRGDILREARGRRPSDTDRFQRTVRENVDKGVPLLWTVHLGLLGETFAPQANGGHMRLIIGYNQKTRDILYTDSWGTGHEIKRMGLADAWTISTGLTKIEPL